MKAAIQSTVGVLLTLLVAGWSFVSHAAPSDKFANIHTIGIISVIGQKLTLANIGFFRFTNSSDSVSITDWHLDARTSDEIGAVLAPRFTVKPVTYDPTIFADIQPRYFFGSREGEIGKRIQAIGSNGVDAYVLVLPASFQGRDGQINDMLTGVGLSDHIGGTTAFAHYSVYVLNASDGTVLASGEGYSPERDLFRYVQPEQAVDTSLMPDSPGSFSPDQRSKVKAVIEGLIDESINHALADAELIDDSLKLVPAGPPQSAAAQIPSPQSTH